MQAGSQSQSFWKHGCTSVANRRRYATESRVTGLGRADYICPVCIVSRGRTTQVRTSNMVTMNALLRHVGPVLLFVVSPPKNLLFRKETLRCYSPMLCTVHLQAREKGNPIPAARELKPLTSIPSVWGGGGRG